jgi:hypothetical protein
MAVFKLYDCDFGVTIRDVNYDFEHVMSLAIEDPEKTRLVRGANGGNKTGLVYKEGLKDAKTITVTIAGMSSALFALLKAAFEEQTRLDCYCVSRTDGSSKIAKNAVLSQEPKQLSLDDSAESLNVVLAFESFDVSEVHKS